MYQIIIKNGIIIDGTGAPMFRGDIGIKEGHIAEIGNLQNEAAEEVIDAQDRFVTPGFIDVNNHSDTYWQIFLDPELKSLLYQGITTIIGGNCGSSLAPLASQRAIHSIQKWADMKKVSLDWMTVQDFLRAVERLKLSVNFGTLIGHSTIRRGILPEGRSKMNLGEIKTAQKMVDQAMKEGALGLSTGLIYTHAKEASQKEILTMAKAVAKRQGIYVTHIRGERHGLLGAIGEAIETSQLAGVKLHIAHLKVVGEKNWGLQGDALAMIEQAKIGGLDISFDVYPYTLTGSVLYTLLPDWVVAGGKRMMLGRLKDPQLRARIISEMQQSEIDYATIIVSVSGIGKELKRKKIVDLAQAQAKSVEESVLDVLVASDGRVMITMEVLSQKNVERALEHPFSIVASNGSGYDLNYKKSGDLVHPRNFGAFPRVFRQYVRDKKILSWEEAVHKMTGKPAQHFSLDKRGTLKKGNWADVAVFDPKIIADKATVDNPFQYAEGVLWVLVNGEIVLQNGNYNGRRAGRVIRKEKSFFS